MDFAEALKMAKMGSEIARYSWKSKFYLTAEYAKHYPPSIVAVDAVSRKRTPWQPTTEDLFAEDWWIIP